MGTLDIGTVDGWWKVEGYKDLKVYQAAYELALRVHKTTDSFPKSEKYELGRQLRRAAFSVALNLAEGYGRKRSQAEFANFVCMSMGSANEVAVLIDAVRDLGYLDADEH